MDQKLDQKTHIAVHHKISVDICIAEEIEKLNNDHNIFTLSSSCGHDKESGSIIVAGSDIQEMIDLGYDIINIKYLSDDIGTDNKIVMCGFEPKSKCKLIRQEKNND